MSAFLVIIFVAAGEANHPATLGAAGAARELGGAEVDVEVREMDAVPSDDRALSVGSALHAAAIVELSWDPPEHRQARIRFHLEPRSGWSDRAIAFTNGDDMGERGRTVGYAIASMLTAPSEPPHPSATPAVPVSNAAPAVTARPVELPVRTRHHGALDVAAAGASGIDGPAAGWGGSLSGRWYFVAPLAVRFGASARSGQVAQAQSTSLLLHLAAGLAWVPLAATSTNSFELGGRIDALFLREQLTHFDSDDAEPVTAMRWLPGADAILEGTWFFSPNAGFLAAFGPELAFGRTDVTIHQVVVTSIPSLRLVFQAGVRATF